MIEINIDTEHQMLDSVPSLWDGAVETQGYGIESLDATNGLLVVECRRMWA